MNEGIIGGILFLGVIGFITLFVLILCKRGEHIRMWIRPIPCFPRSKSNRPLRIKITTHVVQTLSPNLIAIFDETMKKMGDTEKDKELKAGWEKIKKNPNNFTIWCIRFKKKWVVSGEKGRLVFAFSFFSPQEMTRLRGSKKEINCLLLNPPLYVHHPISKNDWIKLRIDEAKANVRKITPELRKKIEKSHRFAPKESWISLILQPTTLSVTEEATLVERLTGFGDLFKIVTNSMRALTEMAEFETYKHAVKTMLEVKRELITTIHALQDDKGHNARTIQTLEHQVKMLRVSLKLSPDMEEFPRSIPGAAKQENDTKSELKKALKTMDYMESGLLTIAALGFIFTVVGFFVTVATTTMWPILMAGMVLLFFGFGGFMWKKRGEQPIEKQSNNNQEPTMDAV